MTDNYNRLKAATTNYNKKPVVAWTTYNAPSQYNNNTASYLLSTAQYKTQLTQDAGNDHKDDTHDKILRQMT